ncbi:APC family permease [Paraburkholderia sp. BR10923]|uniref:APC family permease n=1 Tax=Paraburkholderia sp. BR10923 TaxID=3236992 RepID=UPI0034CEF07C
MSAIPEPHALEPQGSLKRSITWTGAFWVASGASALVLFSIGSIAATVGKLSWAVWMISISLGFIQSFSYAEIAGLFPHKSGGASVYGAIAWVRYSKLLAPLSVWCSWFGWSPVIAIGSGLGAGYVLTIMFPPEAAINTWQITLVNLDWLRSGLSLRINATFILGAAILLVTFAMQNRGILRTARIQMTLGVLALIPLIIVGTVPLLHADLPLHNLLPLLPFARDASGQIVDGTWGRAGITLMAGGLFIAGYSTYAFETAICYTREFRDPKIDTFKANLYSGLLCIFVFTVLPLSFQGVLGLGHLVTPEVKDAAGHVVTPAVYSGMLAPDIYSGLGIAKAMAPMIHGGPFVERVLAVMLVLALVQAIMTAMAGSSRTLYQASREGWLPKYLSYVNQDGAPTRAMWTDLCFNLILLLMSDYVFVLAMSNVGYIIFIFLNLNAAWIHRRDRPDWHRPFRAPNWLLALGTLFSFVNLGLLGMGSNIWGSGTLISGLAFAAMIIPVFLYRHYVTDKGIFPETMMEDMHRTEEGKSGMRAGLLPYWTIIAGVLVVAVTRSLAVY